MYMSRFSLSCIGEGNGNPLQCSCLENPRDGEAWWAVVYGVIQSGTRLKRLSSSSSRYGYPYIRLSILHEYSWPCLISHICVCDYIIICKIDIYVYIHIYYVFHIHVDGWCICTCAYMCLCASIQEKEKI